MDYKSPLGDIIIAIHQDKVCMVDWKYRKMRTQIDTRIEKLSQSKFENKETNIGIETIRQLSEYFEQKRTQFDLPLALLGSEFQVKVWKKLIEIPYGDTMSYATLSSKLNNPLAIRAVAAANGANGISIIIPCHRIIGSNGELTGYAGGLNAKRKLLQLESPIMKQQDIFA